MGPLLLSLSSGVRMFDAVEGGMSGVVGAGREVE